MADHAPAERSEAFAAYALPSISEDAELELETTIYAEPEEAGTPLSDALALVWREHPNVQRALAEVEATGFEISGARSAFYPFVSVTARQASNDASATTVNLIQPLWSGGRGRAELSEAKANEFRALAELNQTRLDLALETSDAYLQVVLAQEQSKLWQRYIRNLKRLLQTIKRRAELGASPPADIQTAQTRLSQALAGLQSSRALLLGSRLHLESLVHRRVDRVNWPAELYRLSHAEMYKILNGGAQSLHPAPQTARAEIAVQRAKMRAAKAAVYPQLSLQHSAQIDQSAGDFTPDSSTQLVLQFSSDSGLKGYSSYRAIDQRLRGAEQDLRYAQRNVTDIVSSAYSERNVSQEQFYAQLEAARAAVQLVDSFLRQFKVGRKAWLEVLNAHREAHEALLQLSAIKKNYWSANTRLALHGMQWSRLSEAAPPSATSGMEPPTDEL